jgi:hypothetical protein
MNKLLLILVPLALSGAARADKTCSRTGAPLIAEVHKTDAIDVGDGGFEIYASGAWHFYRHDPKAMASADTTGCLTEQELASVKAALAKAAWKVTHNTITCDAMAVGHTEWIAGKHSYADVMCGSESIDSTTAQLFTLVEKLERDHMLKK